MQVFQSSSLCLAAFSYFPWRTEEIKMGMGMTVPLTPHAWVHAETHKYSCTFPWPYTATHSLKLRSRDLCIMTNIRLCVYTNSQTRLHTLTYFCPRAICLHVEMEEGEQCSVFEHEWADVVAALHAWVRLYSTWLQNPTGLAMGGNTLTQLSDQTNWVWDFVCTCV